MTTDNSLRERLHDESERLPAPLFVLDEVVRGGKRRRLRARLLGGAGVVTVAAVFVAVAVFWQGRGPETGPVATTLPPTTVAPDVSTAPPTTATPGNETTRPPPSSDASVPSGEMTTTILQSAADALVGNEPSVLIGGDGLPLIVYGKSHPNDAQSGEIWLAACSEPSCDTHVDSLLAEDALFDPPPYAALLPNGSPVVLYPVLLVPENPPGQPARVTSVVLTCHDRTCVTSTATALDVGGDAIAIGQDGLPIIVYLREGEIRMRYCDDPECSTEKTDVPLHVYEGGSSNLLLAVAPDGRPVVTRNGGGPPGVQPWYEVIVCVDPECSDATVTRLATVSDIGWPPIPGFTRDGLPVIHFQDGNEIVAATCEDSSCSSFSLNTIAERDRLADMASALGHDGATLVAWPTGRGAIGVTRCVDTDCRSATFDETNLPVAASWISLAVPPDGLPVVVYPTGGPGNNRRTMELVITKCGHPYCEP